MTEHVQGGTVNQDTGGHIPGSGLADEVSTAYTSTQTHFTHTGALQQTKLYDSNGITISKRPDPESFDDEDEVDNYGQIFATSKQVYDYLKNANLKIRKEDIKQWENTVSLKRSPFSKDSYRHSRNVEGYPTRFFKIGEEWYETTQEVVTTFVDPVLNTSTAENLDKITTPIAVIKWEYNVEKDVFEKVPGKKIGSNEKLFQSSLFGTGTSEQKQDRLAVIVNVLDSEKAFYEHEKNLDDFEVAQLIQSDADFTADKAAKGNIVSQSFGALVTAATGLASSLLPGAAVGGTSAAPAAAYSAAATAAAAAAAAGGTSSAAAAPVTLAGAAAAVAGAAAAAPVTAAAAAAAAVLGVGGLVTSQLGQQSANSAVKKANDEVEEARKAVEISRAANQRAETLIGNLKSVRETRKRHDSLIHALTSSNHRRRVFRTVAVAHQQHRVAQMSPRRTLSRSPRRTPKRKPTPKSKRTLKGKRTPKRKPTPKSKRTPRSRSSRSRSRR